LFRSSDKIECAEQPVRNYLISGNGKRNTNMAPSLMFFIMVNNYLHDLAATAFTVSGIVLLLALRRHRRKADSPEWGPLTRTCRRMKIIAVASLTWISVGAIPRILAFTHTELPASAEKGQTGALIAEHALILCTVICGAVLWIYLNRGMRTITTLHKGGL